MAEYCNSRSITPKVATVGKLPLMNGFAARVASNRGLAAETFSESQKAMDWLKGFGSNDRRPQDRLTTRSLDDAGSVLLGNEPSAFHGGLIVVGSFLGSLRQLYLLPAGWQVHRAELPLAQWPSHTLASSF
jgi:hypothetical protein